MNSKCVLRGFANWSFRLFSDNLRVWLRFGFSTGNQSSQRSYHKNCESLGPKAWHAVSPFLASAITGRGITDCRTVASWLRSVVGESPFRVTHLKCERRLLDRAGRPMLWCLEIPCRVLLLSVRRCKWLQKISLMRANNLKPAFPATNHSGIPGSPRANLARDASG